MTPEAKVKVFQNPKIDSKISFYGQNLDTGNFKICVSQGTFEMT